MRSEQYYVIDGVKYTIKRPGPRQDLKQLAKNGIVARLDFAANFDWLRAVIEKWGDNPQLLKPTYEYISGLWLKMPEGDVLVKATRLHPKDKESYCLDCYNMDDKSCELQIMANIMQTPAKYCVVPFYTKGVNTEQIWTVAQVMSTILLGVKIYINITKFRVFDEVTRTEGCRIVDIDPIIFRDKDILLEC